MSSGMCSAGHIWVGGQPTCSCDATPMTEIPGYVKYLVEPLADDVAKTVVGPNPEAKKKTVLTPPPAAPILSEDGWWQWDGAAWVPAETPPTETALPSSARVAAPAEAVAVPAPRGPEDTPEWAQWATPALVGASVGGGPPPAIGGPTAAPPPAPYDAAVPAPRAVSPASSPTVAPAVTTPVRGRRGVAPKVAAAVAVVVLGGGAGAYALQLGGGARHAAAATADTTTDVPVKAQLAAVAQAESTYRQAHGGYGPLAAVVPHPPAGMQLQVRTTADGFCVAGAATGTGRWYLYDSAVASFPATAYASPAEALAGCQA